MRRSGPFQAEASTRTEVSLIGPVDSPRLRHACQSPRPASSFTNHDPIVASSVWLPDGRRYRLFYNSYAELARVELPTGGAFEYDYTPNPGLRSGVDEFQIYRRVVERRVLSDGTTVSGKTTYPINGAGDFLGSVQQHAASGTLLAKSNHIFSSNPVDSLFPLPPASGGSPYSKWQEGREVQTERLAVSGGTAGSALQRVNQTFQQRAAVPWWSWWAAEGHSGSSFDEPANDPRLTQSVTTLVDNNQVTKQTFSYDLYNNQTDVFEYDYGSGAAPAFATRRTHFDYLTTNAVNSGVYNNPSPVNLGLPIIHLRSLPVREIVYSVNSGTGVETWAAQTEYEYDRYDTSAYHAALVSRANISGHDGAFTNSYQTRGNVTQVDRWLAAGGSPKISSRSQFDIAGNAVKQFDGRGNAVDFDFSDRFGSADGDARANAGATELAGQTSFAFASKVTNSLGHESYTQFDYYIGKPVDIEDPNQIKSSLYYADALDRPTKSISAVGTAAQAQTNVSYDDDIADRVITTAVDKVTYAESEGSNPAGFIVKTYYDGLGRTYRGASYEGNTGGGGTWSITVHEFDDLGRTKRTTNAFRATSPTAGLPQTPEWITTDYDALDRTVSLTSPDNAKVTTVYVGNQVTVTDQANKRRRSLTDALGRLTKVTEDPFSGPGSLNYQTTYTYDALDNLRKVDQVGQTRFFAYDPLSRLIRANNPELEFNTHSSMTYADPVTGNSQWTMAYTYDENGNLTERREARSNASAEPIKTTYTYDALNRNTFVVYNDGTASIERVYDNAASGANGKGRFYKDFTYHTEGAVARYVHNIVTQYDPMGRVKSKSQQFLAGTDPNYVWLPYDSSVTYDLAGNVLSETYPSGRTVATTYDQGGRVSTLSSNGGTLLNNFTYTPFGAVLKHQFSNGLWGHRRYNSRLQMDRLRVGTDSNPDNANAASHIGLEYTFSDGTGNGGGPNNNGNVRTQAIAPVPSVTPYVQTYTFDNLNRLKVVEEKQAATTTVKQTWGYDRYGNRWSDINNTTQNFASPITQEGNFIPATNRINPNTLPGYSYDKAGNVISEPGAKGYGYDAENRIRVYCESGSAGCVSGAIHTTYVHDADGRRVKKISGGNTIYFVYGVFGQLIAEYSSIAPSDTPGTRFVTSDHLGSTRLLVNATSGQVMARYDYLPFGEELPASLRPSIAGYAPSSGGIRQKFASTERDSETGLDYSVHRHNASTQGRFTGPDPYVIFFEMKRARDAQGSSQMLGEFISQPQNWPKYGYALNNPLKYTDPTGMRPPTAYEQSALDRLTQLARQEGNSELGDALRAAKSEISGIIDSLADGNTKDVGVDIAVNAILNIGNSDYSNSGTVSVNGGVLTIGVRTNKCNILIAAAHADGAGLGFTRNGRGNTRGYPLIDGRAPAANWLGDARDIKNLTNLQIVADGAMKPGDIVAWRSAGGQSDGHSTINIGGSVLVYAGGPPHGTPQAKTFDFVNQRMINSSHEPAVVRRYNGKP